MIAKGTLHNNGAKLAVYMTTGKEGERAELWQLRGFAAADIKDAFRSVHVMAAATQGSKPFFHVQVRNPEGEELTRPQWERVADRIEAKLGYSGQPRAIAFHRDEATGHEHMHLAFSRIDDATMTMKPLPFFKLRLKEVSRELEQELGLTAVRNERPGKVMAPRRDEEEQARRLGVDLKPLRDTIRDCYERADSGKAFVAALAEQDLILAQGERRDFVVIDQAGGLHALGKRVLGTTAAQTRDRLADLEYAALPTVEAVRQQLGNRAPETTQPVVDLQRAAFFASVAARTAERDAMQPANAIAATTAHKTSQVTDKLVDAGATLAGGVGKALGGVLQLAEGPVNFVIDFLTGGSDAQREQAARHSARVPLKDTTMSTPKETLHKVDPGRVHDISIRELARSNPTHVHPELEAALRRQREAEERARRDRER